VVLYYVSNTMTKKSSAVVALLGEISSAFVGLGVAVASLDWIGGVTAQVNTTVENIILSDLEPVDKEYVAVISAASTRLEEIKDGKNLSVYESEKQTEITHKYLAVHLEKLTHARHKTNDRKVVLKSVTTAVLAVSIGYASYLIIREVGKEFLQQK
jgi:hypothetical protein